MKQKLILFAIAVIFTGTTFAQEGGQRRQMVRRTVEERVATMHFKFDSVYHFDASKQAKIDTAFAEFYRAQDKMREEMMAGMQGGGQPDPALRDKMREMQQELTASRDEKLQGIMTEAEYKKWKDELEPSLRPARGAGGPGGGGRGNGQGNGGN